MSQKIMPYALPLMSILVIAALFLFAKPALTGFAVKQNPTLNAEIRITANEILPENAVISIYLQDKNNNTIFEIEDSSMKKFVERYNLSLTHTEGSNKELDFQGAGYIGDVVFKLDNIEVKDLKTGTYYLKTEINWGEEIVSETRQEMLLKQN